MEIVRPSRFNIYVCVCVVCLKNKFVFLHCLFVFVSVESVESAKSLSFFSRLFVVVVAVIETDFSL